MMLRALLLLALAPLAATQPSSEIRSSDDEPGHARITLGLRTHDVVRDLDLTRPLDLLVRLRGGATALDALAAALDRVRPAASAAGAAPPGAPERLADGRVRVPGVPRGALGALTALPAVEGVAFERPFAGPLGEGEPAPARGGTVTVRITTDRPLPYVLFAGQDGAGNDVFVEDYVAVTPTTLDVEVPPGTYDLLVYAFTVSGPFAAVDPALVVREGLVVSEPVTLDVPTAAAVHVVELDGVDAAGARLFERDPNPTPSSSVVRYESRHRLVYPEGSPILFVASPLVFDDHVRVSDLSERFRLLASEHLADFQAESDVYVVQHAPVVGVTEGLTLANAPADLVSATARARLPAPGVLAVRNVSHVRLPGRTAFEAIGFFVPNQEREVWEVGLHLTPDVDEALAFTASLSFHIPTLPLAWAVTDPFRAEEGRIASFSERTASPATYWADEGDVLPFGSGPIWADVFGDGVGGEGEIAAFARFSGMLHEERQNDYTVATWRIEDASASVVAEGEGPTFVYVPPVPGPYRAVVTDPNTLVGNARGSGTLTAGVDTRQEDATAPKLTSLLLLDGAGDAVAALPDDEPATLQFSAGDFGLSAEGLEGLPLDEEATAVYVRPFDAEAWEPLPHELLLTENGTSVGLGHDPIGSLYRVDLSALTAAGPGGYDLRIDVADPAGNTLSWVLEPGLVVGDFPFPTAAGPTPPAAAFALATYPNPAVGPVTVRYELAEAAPVRLAVFDVLGREVARLVDAPRPAGTHTARFDGAGLPAGLYIVRLKHPSGAATHTVTLVH